MASIPFNLTDEDYWKDPWRDFEKIDEEFVFGRQWGLHIGAPGIANLEQRKKLPVPFLYVAQLRDSCKVNLETMTKAVACRLEDRAFFIGNALAPKGWEGEPPAATDSTDLTCAKYTLDLGKRLGLLKQPGTYRIALLLQQQMSNILTTRIGPLPDSSGEQFRGELASSELLGSFTPPEIPAQPAIALKVERVVLDTPEASASLKGSFRLPVLPHERVGHRTWPSAILPITIVILANGSAAETVIRLRVPVFHELDAIEPIATGTFAIDLLSAPGIRGRAGIYSTYAFCGEFFTGPAIMATVTEDMLPIGKQLR
jgi:hypothetical protein